MTSRHDIEQAAERIRPYVRRTPVLELDPRVTLKLELLQHAGSFKPRGAFNRMLSNPVPAAGVVTASGGNHGAAVAFAARALGHKAEIFLPETSSPAKMARVRSYGAELHVGGSKYTEALAASNARAAETGALIVHAFDQPETLAGQGTLGPEMQAQVPDMTTVLIACGGGGLIGGISAWFRGDVKVISVEPHSAPSLERALAAGSPVNVEIGGLAADSLGATRVGELMFPLAQQFVDRAILVSDDDIRNAQKFLWDRFRLMAEPGGATALAALLSGAYKPAPEEKLVVLVCGSNVDPATIA